MSNKRNKRSSNTCLAMLRDKKGRLWFAGDRRMSWHMGKAMKAPRPKVTFRGEVLLAGTGVSCVCDLVTDQFDIPLRLPGIGPYKYMTEVFVPYLIHWLQEENWVAEGARCLKSNSEDSLEDDLSATIVIGVADELFELDLNSSFIAVDAIDAPYAAGCGGSLALGSLLTTEALGLNEKKRLTLALKVAARVSPGCDDNIDIIHN